MTALELAATAAGKKAAMESVLAGATQAEAYAAGQAAAADFTHANSIHAAAMAAGETSEGFGLGFQTNKRGLAEKVVL